MLLHLTSDSHSLGWWENAGGEQESTLPCLGDSLSTHLNHSPALPGGVRRMLPMEHIVSNY